MINSSHKELSQTLQPYSLTLELKTESDKIKKIIVPFQSRYHGTITGESQKTRPVLYAAMAADLEEKLRNDALRKQKLEELKRGGNIILPLPEEEFQNQYNRICDQYRTCCMIVVASDNQLCDAAARLAISHGVEPRIIDATLEGDRLAEFGQYTVGLNPFNLPECVKEDAPNYLIKTAENTLTVLSEVAPERMKTDEPYIDALKEKLMTAIVFITILHCQYVSKYDADWVEVHLVATGFGILKKMLDELETRAEENSALLKILQSEKGKAIVDFTRNQLAALHDPVTNECLSDIRAAILKLFQNPSLEQFLDMPAEKNIDLLRSFDDGNMIIVNYGLKENTIVVGLLFQLMVAQAMLYRPHVLPLKYHFTPVFEYIDNIHPLLPENWLEQIMALGRKYDVALLCSMPTQTQPVTDPKEAYIRDLLFNNRTIVSFAPSNYELEYFKKNLLNEKDLELLQKKQESIIFYGVEENETSFQTKGI